jgi:hypothetical protein
MEQFTDVDLNYSEANSERLAVDLAVYRLLSNTLYDHLKLSAIRLSGDQYFRVSAQKVNECLAKAELILGINNDATQEA